MAVRVRRIPTLIAVLVLAATFASPSFSGSRDTNPPAAMPTIYVVYTMNCTFSLVDDFGKHISSIPPGNYQIEVSTPVMFKLVRPGGPGVDEIAPNDFTGCKGWVQFELTGPGVNLFTTLDSGCDAFLILPEQTFKPNSTYTAQDLNQPSVAHASFSTLASGSPTIPKSPYGPTSGKGTLQQDLVGSLQRSAVKATLAGSIDAKGKLTLAEKGKPVSVLKAGRYKFAITDRSPKAAFTLEAVNGGIVKDLTQGSFVGKHAVTVVLTSGRWMYYSNRGKASYFLVTR
jgi:hypothetical protein